ncbi:TetR/AcrR family transcriptional regulator [Actinomadura sp. 6N118]|uniref:TetR/AcrR family transcriptional regulator n=1 Tax=Actinomadura sp. 6N118 TaxID=3375151 RepID=UPI0037909353
MTLKDVARRAGVGVGTVYRHFPTKDDLLDALFADRLASATDCARAAAADPDGWRGLVRYVEESMHMQVGNCGLRGLVVSTAQQPTGDQIPGGDRPLVEQMVAKAQQQGTLRPDFGAEDVTLIQIALAAIISETASAQVAISRSAILECLGGRSPNGHRCSPVLANLHRDDAVPRCASPW